MHFFSFCVLKTLAAISLRKPLCGWKRAAVPGQRDCLRSQVICGRTGGSLFDTSLVGGSHEPMQRAVLCLNLSLRFEPWLSASDLAIYNSDLHPPVYGAILAPTLVSLAGFSVRQDLTTGGSSWLL